MKLSAEIFRTHNVNLSSCVRLYDVVPKDFCEELIEWFEQSITFRIDDHRKQSTELQIIGDPRPEAVEYKHRLFDYLYPLGEQYETDIYSKCHNDFIPTDVPMTKAFNTGFRSLQIQKYTPEDKGYPAVHIEAGPEHLKKYLAVILYLNDIDSDDGGETVFPMCGRAVEPEAGTAVIFPTGIPFYHCGRPSKIDKYIVTSWFEFM